MIFGLLLLFLLFPILRMVFGLAGWVLGIVGTLIAGVVILALFAVAFKFFLAVVAVAVVWGLARRTVN